MLMIMLSLRGGSILIAYLRTDESSPLQTAPRMPQGVLESCRASQASLARPYRHSRELFYIVIATWGLSRQRD